MKRKPFVHWTLILTAAFCLACGSENSQNADAETAAAEGTNGSIENVQRRTVVTASAEQIEFRETVDLSAEITPWAAVNVAAEATGRIVELPVEVGDRIREGTVIARIDDTMLRAEMARAEAQLNQAKATLAQAEKDLSRGEQLEKTQDISVGDLDRLALARDTARAEVSALEATLSMKSQNLEDTEVRAPFGGVVSDRMVEVGTWISPGSPILRLVDQSRVKVRGSASQRDRARIETGMRADVRVDALPGALFEGKVRLLGQEADERTGTYLVEAQVSNPKTEDGRQLLPGMQASLSVELGVRPALVVPRASIVQTPAGEGLYVVRGQTAVFVQPETGAVTSDRIEILSELNPEEPIVVIGQHVLRDGDAVEIDEERSRALSRTSGTEETSS